MSAKLIVPPARAAAAKSGIIAALSPDAAPRAMTSRRVRRDCVLITYPFFSGSIARLPAEGQPMRATNVKSPSRRKRLELGMTEEARFDRMRHPRLWHGD